MTEEEIKQDEHRDKLIEAMQSEDTVKAIEACMEYLLTYGGYTLMGEGEA